MNKRVKWSVMFQSERNASVYLAERSGLVG
jgi:hypothetical protein